MEIIINIGVIELPFKPLHPCNHSNCPRLTKSRFCAEHQRKVDAAYDKERGNSGERGYGSDHRRWRERILDRDPLCVKCLDKGIVKAATDADHIDPNGSRLALDNGQGLCHECHSRKTAREDGRWGR